MHLLKRQKYQKTFVNAPLVITAHCKLYIHKIFYIQQILKTWRSLWDARWLKDSHTLNQQGCTLNFHINIVPLSPIVWLQDLISNMHLTIIRGIRTIYFKIYHPNPNYIHTKLKELLLGTFDTSSQLFITILKSQVSTSTTIVYNHIFSIEI